MLTIMLQKSDETLSTVEKYNRANSIKKKNQSSALLLKNWPKSSRKVVYICTWLTKDSW